MIVSQPKELIAAFVNMRQGLPHDNPWGNFTAIGLVRADTLVAGLIYNNAANTNICVHIGAVDGHRWGTPEFLFAAFDYPFNQLGMTRLTASVRSKNERMQAIVKKLGFSYEGTLREFYEDDDLKLYGLLKRECKYLMRKAA